MSSLRTSVYSKTYPTPILINHEYIKNKITCVSQENKETEAEKESAKNLLANLILKALHNAKDSTLKESIEFVLLTNNFFLAALVTNSDEEAPNLALYAPENNRLGIALAHTPELESLLIEQIIPQEFWRVYQIILQSKANNPQQTFASKNSQELAAWKTLDYRQENYIKQLDQALKKGYSRVLAYENLLQKSKQQEDKLSQSEEANLNHFIECLKSYRAYTHLIETQNTQEAIKSRIQNSALGPYFNFQSIAITIQHIAIITGGLRIKAKTLNYKDNTLAFIDDFKLSQKIWNADILHCEQTYKLSRFDKMLVLLPNSIKEIFFPEYLALNQILKASESTENLVSLTLGMTISSKPFQSYTNNEIQEKLQALTQIVLPNNQIAWNSDKEQKKAWIYLSVNEQIKLSEFLQNCSYPADKIKLHKSHLDQKPVLILEDLNYDMLLRIEHLAKQSNVLNHPFS